jgi:hypothetical protein
LEVKWRWDKEDSYPIPISLGEGNGIGIGLARLQGREAVAQGTDTVKMKRKGSS